MCWAHAVALASLWDWFLIEVIQSYFGVMYQVKGFGHMGVNLLGFEIKLGEKYEDSELNIQRGLLDWQEMNWQLFW